ncbi:unnamed protein product [Anisakis simplex]|uniref:Uncharacterized protein n=1 Tax=Anisakis simplex TaxID=6269 RepID=A0A3P6QT93_ANISI|nr:unnamed protein product [Anisakis simplex]
MRVAVDDMIEPKASTTYLVGDLVCFKSLIACGAWRESSSSTQMRHFNFIDSDRGIASANQQGNAVISAHVDVDQSIFTEATITSADQIQFGEIPKVISNIPNRRFIFPVHIGNSSDVPNVHGALLS